MIKAFEVHTLDVKISTDYIHTAMKEDETDDKSLEEALEEVKLMMIVVGNRDDLSIVQNSDGKTYRPKINYKMPTVLEKFMIDSSTVLLSFSAGFRFCGPITVGFYITNPADRFRDTQNQYYGLPGQYLRIFDINLENPIEYEKDLKKTKHELNVIDSDNYIDKYLYIINQKVSMNRDYLSEVSDNRIPVVDVVGRLVKTKTFVEELIPFKLIEKLPNYIHYDPRVEVSKYSKEISTLRKPQVSVENNSVINNNPLGSTNVNRDPRISAANNNTTIQSINNANTNNSSTSNRTEYYNLKRNYSEINPIDVDNDDSKRIKIDNQINNNNEEEEKRNKENEEKSKRIIDILNKYKVTNKPKDIPVKTKTLTVDEKDKNKNYISDSESDSESNTVFTYSDDD